MLLKNIVARPRPFDAYTDYFSDHKTNGFSFPSGHTCASFACALILFQNAYEEIWNSGSDPGRNGSLLKTLPGSPLSGRCSGRISGSSICKLTLVYHLMSAYQKKMQEQS